MASHNDSSTFCINLVLDIQFIVVGFGVIFKHKKIIRLKQNDS